MQHCDVLVVGGGPAGSACAGALRSQGANVLVMDRAQFPRDKVCAGWITPDVVQVLGLDLADYARTRVLQPFRGFRTGLIGGAALESRYPRTVSYGIRRVEFDHDLLQRADVPLALGTPVRTIERRGQQWVINHNVAASMVVGAGGHFCPVARWLNPPDDSAPQVVAQEMEFRLSPAQVRDSPVRGDTPELFFCRDLKGYGWCLRKDDYLNVGLGREDAAPLPGQLDDFCAWLQARGTIPAQPPARFHGHAYRLWHPDRQVRVGDGMLLVGDAAGLARPQSGEGILPAIESGLLAARTIGAAAGDYRRETLTNYATQLQAGYGGNTALPLVGPRSAALQAALGRVLLGSRWFSRHVLLDRWFLHPGRLSPAS
jgi:geranylgeranyl reductase family protein